MKYDKLGIPYATVEEVCNLIYKNPDIEISQIYAENPNKYNDAVDTFYADLPKLKLYNLDSVDIDEFDTTNQNTWFFPDEYINLDIAKWVLDQCKTQEELQRVGEELFLYQERNLLPLLTQLKYIIDTWRSNNIVWGVGRGSSVASYVLYLIGVHKIDSIYYDLDINEFLR